MKNLFKSNPFVVYFDPNRKTRVYSDASIVGLGGAIKQNFRADKDIWLPCGYFSRLLKDAETRYSIYDLECMAAIETIEYFDDMLDGHKIRVNH